MTLPHRRKTRPSSPRPSERSRYIAQYYGSADQALLSLPNHLFFPSRESLRHVIKPKSPSGVHPMDFLHGLCTRRDLVSFDIYPTCSHSLSINSLLHDGASTGSFDTNALEQVLGVHILVLGLAPELHQFLSTTPKEEVDTAIIDFLVLLHHQLESENDIEGLRRMEEDLEPTVCRRLQHGIGVFPDGEPPPGRRADVLEQIVQLAFLTPWRVDVWGAYITRTELTDLRSGLLVTGDVTAAKLLKDWIVFSEVLQGVVPDWGIADGLERAVCEGNNHEILARVRQVSLLVRDVNSFLNRLPRDVVERCLIPWVVRSECEALPSRRRIVAPLECTPAGITFLDELENADDEMINRLAIDRNGLAIWREWAAAHGTGAQHTKDLCFPLDKKPWDEILDECNSGVMPENDFESLLSSVSERLDHGDSSRRRSFIRSTRLLL